MKTMYLVSLGCPKNLVDSEVMLAALEQHGGRTPSFKNRRILDLLGNNAPDPHWPLHRSFMRIIDFIAGMTDSYATEMARAMTGHSSPA